MVDFVMDDKDGESHDAAPAASQETIISKETTIVVGPSGPGGGPGAEPAIPEHPERLNPSLVPLDVALAVLAKAREDHKALDVQIQEASNRRAAIGNEIDALIAKRDEQAILIEKYTPRAAHAESVKAIQKQTTDQLADRKERSRIAAEALRASGAGNFHPSALDAAYANRKRTPEQVANLAKSVHQRAQEQIAERG